MNHTKTKVVSACNLRKKKLEPVTDTDADVWEMGARLIKSTNCCLYHKILVSFCTMLEKQRNFPGRLPIALATACRNIFLAYRL